MTKNTILILTTALLIASYDYNILKGQDLSARNSLKENFKLYFSTNKFIANIIFSETIHFNKANYSNLIENDWVTNFYHGKWQTNAYFIRQLNPLDLNVKSTELKKGSVAIKYNDSYRYINKERMDVRGDITTSILDTEFKRGYVAPVRQYEYKLGEALNFGIFNLLPGQIYWLDDSFTTNSTIYNYKVLGKLTEFGAGANSQLELSVKYSNHNFPQTPEYKIKYFYNNKFMEGKLPQITKVYFMTIDGFVLYSTIFLHSLEFSNFPLTEREFNLEEYVNSNIISNSFKRVGAEVYKLNSDGLFNKIDNSKLKSLETNRFYLIYFIIILHVLIIVVLVLKKLLKGRMNIE